MAKLTLTDLSSETGFLADVNANSALIETALDNTVSRDGTSPNQMNANLDMNSNRVMNLPSPQNANDAVRYQDLLGSGLIQVTGTTVIPDPSAATVGDVLTTDGTVNAVWTAIPDTNTLGIDDLVAPAGDRILFYDIAPSAKIDFMTVGLGLDLTLKDLTLSHLGIEALTDPGADRILFWDDGGTATGWLTANAPLNITTTNLTLALPATDLGSGVDVAADWMLVQDATDGVWKKINPDQFAATPVGTSVTKITTVDVSRDTNVPSVDAELAGWSVDATSFYTYEACLQIDNPTSTLGNFACQIVPLAALTKSYGANFSTLEDSTSSKTPESGAENLETYSRVDIRNSDPHVAIYSGYIETNGATTIDFHWAKAVLDAGFPTFLRKGSWIRLTKIA